MQIKFHEPVFSADNIEIGSAQRIYHVNHEQYGVAIEPYTAYLKIFSFTSGDSYFIPIEFIDERDAPGLLTARLTMKEIERRMLSAMPRPVAYGEAEPEELATA